MNLRNYLRQDFKKYIREVFCKEECECCGATDKLHLHHNNPFHEMLMETLEELTLNELDTTMYSSKDLETIRNYMLAKQVKTTYKTLCERCHINIHKADRHVYSERYCNPFGDYFMLKYENIPDIKGVTMACFLKLCCHMNYSNYVEWGRSKDKMIRKKDLFEILNTKKTNTYRVISELEDNNLIIYDKKGIKINENVCYKGFRSGSNRFIKIFIKSYIYIYETIPSSQHGVLAKVFKLCEHMNIKNNILCKNEYIETDKENRLTQTEISSILNSNSLVGLSKTIRALRRIKLKNNPILDIIVINDVRYLVVNSELMYKGNLTKDILIPYELIENNNKPVSEGVVA